MADIADKLDEARALIEKGWTQAAFAKDGFGNLVEYGDEFQPVCFCALGAISMAVRGQPDADYFPSELSDYEAPLRKIIGAENNASAVADWNDDPERTQAEVIEAFKKAAELARAEA